MKALLLLISLYTFIPAANLKGIKGIKGKVARHFVADKAFMSDVELEIISVESDGILIGKVVLQDGKNLGVEMLKGGLAWWDKRATPGEKALAKVEA